MVTGIVYHRKYLEHEQTPTHPERKERLAYTMDQLMEEGIFEDRDIRLIEPIIASEQDVLQVHTQEYVEFLKRESKNSTIGTQTYQLEFLRLLYLPLVEL